MAEQDTYANVQAALDALQPGWKSLGPGRPYYASVPNVAADGGPPAANEPQTVVKEMGTIFPIRGPNGENDEITLGPTPGSTVAWNTTPGAPLPKALVVIKGPQNQPTQGTQPGSAITDWVRLDASGQVTTDPTKTVFIRDPKAPPTTQPFKITEGGTDALGDPSTWTPIRANPQDPSSRVIGLYSPKADKVAASVAADTSDKPSDPGAWTPVYRTPGNAASGIVGQWDPVNAKLYPVAKDAATQKQVIQTPNVVLLFNEDGTLFATHPIADKKAPPSVHAVGNTLYAFDPSAEPGKQFTKGPEVDDPDPNVVGLSTQNKYFVFIDKKTGKELARVDNPNYEGPQQTAAPPTSLQAPTIPRFNKKTGEWEDVPNTGRLTISDAAAALVKDLTGIAADPDHPMTPEEADMFLRNAIAKMAADAQKAQVEATREGTARAAAGDILTSQAQGATTGAGMLGARAATSQNLIQQGLGLAQSTGGRYGNYSGGIMTLMPGFAADLVHGAMGTATEMHGGQAIMDTAARMVQAADPGGTNPDRAAAFGLFHQILERYGQAAGAPHPTVAATQAMQQSQQQNAFVPPPPPIQNYTPSPYGGVMQPNRQWNTPAETAEQAQARAGVFVAPPLAPVTVPLYGA